ncbi:MAG: UDP-N-acetylenolpyruvoylglucosamine reductase, partial [Pseudomonadales bacterium]
KLSAAQLIDSLGWKDHDDPDLYCWPRQALVLVNRSAERGEDVIDFAAQIQRSVQSNYGVELELEPVVLS